MIKKTKNESIKKTGRHKRSKEYKKFAVCSIHLPYNYTVPVIQVKSETIQKDDKTVNGRILIRPSFARRRIFSPPLHQNYVIIRLIFKFSFWHVYQRRN